MTCHIGGCENPIRVKKWRLCTKHYTRMVRHGDPEWSPPTREERFWSKVDVGHPLGCWMWTGGVTGSGYGGVSWREDGVILSEGAHRFAYLLLVGDIPEGKHLDHLCRERLCVNPDHLEVVTPRENTLRGYGPSAENASRTHCLSGHELSDENVWVDEKRNARHCRTCSRRRWHEWNERQGVSS